MIVSGHLHPHFKNLYYTKHKEILFFFLAPTRQKTRGEPKFPDPSYFMDLLNLL